MNLTRVLVITAAITGGSLAGPAIMAANSYKLDLGRGKFPADVTVENLNGVLPQTDAYKRGWTKDGWIVERLDNRGYVSLTPTYHPGEESENVLSLPAIKVEPGMSLAWEARSVYRYFPESYRVEAVAADAAEIMVLAEVEAESPYWTSYSVDLGDMEGEEVTFRFVCTSRDGYMLALDGVTVADPASAEEKEAVNGQDATEFVRNLFIDHATGMWCTNCMDVESDLEGIMERFGERAIFLNTHVDDALDNDGYWQGLKWYNIPEMMLNRIRATAGSTPKGFENYYDLPTGFGVAVGVSLPEGRAVTAKATVRVSETTDNSTDRYRIGYVVTGNFHEPTNPKFVQSNNCTRPQNGAFYFLPTRIPPQLMFYDDVTLTSETAFTGVEGSLPATLQPGEEYEYGWSVEVPELLEDAAKARVVVFVLDTETGEVLNCAEAYAGTSDTGGIHDITADKGYHDICYIDGCLRTFVPAGEAYSISAYSLAGVKVFTANTVSNGADITELVLPAGVYVIRVDWAGGSSVCKALNVRTL